MSDEARQSVPEPPGADHGQGWRQKPALHSLGLSQLVPHGLLSLVNHLNEAFPYLTLRESPRSCYKPIRIQLMWDGASHQRSADTGAVLVSTEP